MPIPPVCITSYLSVCGCSQQAAGKPLKTEFQPSAKNIGIIPVPGRPARLPEVKDLACQISQYFKANSRIETVPGNIIIGSPLDKKVKIT